MEVLHVILLAIFPALDLFYKARGLIELKGQLGLRKALFEPLCPDLLDYILVDLCYHMWNLTRQSIKPKKKSGHL